MIKQLLKHREALLGAVILLMILAIGSRVPSFIAPGNLVEMFNDTSILIILALGQMMVLLTKGIDLSMAANLALTGMIVALINFHYPDVPVWALLILATGLGLLMGAINGLAGVEARHPGDCGDARHHEHLPRNYFFALRRWLGELQSDGRGFSRPAAHRDFRLACAELVCGSRPAVSGLFPALQPHRTRPLHRGWQRDGGVLHRH